MNLINSHAKAGDSQVCVVNPYLTEPDCICHQSSHEIIKELLYGLFCSPLKDWKRVLELTSQI